MDDSRYSRISRFAPLGEVLAQFRQASCAVVGLGGLGCGLVQHLSRLGVSRLVLVDRDTVEPENLGHQILYTAEHAADGVPKAAAAADAAGAINPDVQAVAQVAELTRHNIDELLGDADLIFDGLDNYFARFTINDYAVKSGKPYFYAGVVRGELSAKAVIPGQTGCLRCLMDSMPAAGEVPTCAAEGVFPPLLAVANALQIDSARKFLAGSDDITDVLYSLDISRWQLRQVNAGGPRADCPACGSRRFEYLDATHDHLARHSCHGDRSEMDVPGGPVDLELVGGRLNAAGEFVVRVNDYCLVARDGEVRYTLFTGGRLIAEGVDGPEELNRFVATYLGT